MTLQRKINRPRSISKSPALKESLNLEKESLNLEKESLNLESTRPPRTFTSQTNARKIEPLQTGKSHPSPHKVQQICGV